MPKLQPSGLNVVHDIIPKGITRLHISQHTPNVSDIQSYVCSVIGDNIMDDIKDECTLPTQCVTATFSGIPFK